MKKISVALLTILAISLLPVTVYGLEYGGIGGKPANPRQDNIRSESIFVYELKPGTTYEDEVEISNNTGQTKKIRVGAVDSAPASDGAFACAQNSVEPVDVGSWITLSKNTVTLENGQTEDVAFTIKVPKDASTGEHGGCITIQEEKSDDITTENEGGVILSFRSAIRVSVTIPGDIIKAITIAGVTLTQSESDSAKLNIRPSLTNTGNVSLDTTITSRLTSVLGTSLEEKTSTYPVFPSTTASWNFDVSRPFWGGWFKATVDATYNANPDEGVGESKNADTQTVRGASEYVFITPSPLALLIEFGVVLAFIIATAGLVHRLKHRRTVKRHWRHHTVVEGESLQKIAKHYHVSWKKLASTNKLKAPYHLEAGDSLKVPPKPAEK